jgi:hypothetical protein
MSAQEREGHARLMAAAGVIEDRRTLSTVVLGGDVAFAADDGLDFRGLRCAAVSMFSRLLCVVGYGSPVCGD